MSRLNKCKTMLLFITKLMETKKWQFHELFPITANMAGKLARKKRWPNHLDLLLRLLTIWILQIQKNFGKFMIKNMDIFLIYSLSSRNPSHILWKKMQLTTLWKPKSDVVKKPKSDLM